MKVEGRSVIKINMALKSKLKFAEGTSKVKQKGIFFILSDQNTFVW